MGNFIEKMNDATASIIDLTKDCVELFNEPFVENFPAEAYRVIEIDGKSYQMKMEVSIMFFEEN